MLCIRFARIPAPSGQKLGAVLAGDGGGQDGAFGLVGGEGDLGELFGPAHAGAFGQHQMAAALSSPSPAMVWPL